MNTQMIDGKCYARMLSGGAAMLAAHREELNALNVFPVADGDTGTNMLLTIEGGLAKANEACESIGELSKLFARGALLAARGNSGVILSQIFAGINDGLAAYDCVGAAELAAAYEHGIEKSYAAVQNPTEGTILTVFRESTEYAKANLDENSTVEDFFRLHIEEARRSLSHTKELLNVLAQADVVDSGAAGYLYIAEGMYKALGGQELSYEIGASGGNAASVDIDAFSRDSVLEYGYCTEFLLRLTTSKVDPDSFDINTVLSVLDELGGQSVVAYKQDDIVKVHVHTFDPGRILSRVQAFGEFLTVKVENMNLGHSQTEIAKPKNHKNFAVVAVAMGDGISALFSRMGADQIVSGGQSANPSIEDFVTAFKACDAENIIVLPNNKNVILAARAAAELYGDASVYVLETKSLIEGYSALSVITPGITDMDTLTSSANRAACDVTGGEITKAVRDATVNGRAVKCGEYMAISEGEIVAVDDCAEDAVLKMLEAADTDLCEIITLFVGKNVADEQRVSLTEQLKELYDECEIVVYDGGQDVYDYLVAIE